MYENYLKYPRSNNVRFVSDVPRQSPSRHLGKSSRFPRTKYTIGILYDAVNDFNLDLRGVSVFLHNLNNPHKIKKARPSQNRRTRDPIRNPGSTGNRGHNPSHLQAGVLDGQEPPFIPWKNSSEKLG